MPPSRRASRSSPSLSVCDELLQRVSKITPLLTIAPELELDEEGTRISLTIVDTPGFGDLIDNEAR